MATDIEIEMVRTLKVLMGHMSTPWHRNQVNVLNKLDPEKWCGSSTPLHPYPREQTFSNMVRLLMLILFLGYQPLGAIFSHVFSSTFDLLDDNIKESKLTG